MKPCCPAPLATLHCLEWLGALLPCPALLPLLLLLLLH